MVPKIKAAIEEIAGALHRLGERQVAERIFELVATVTPDDALALVRITWHAPQDAKQILGTTADHGGIVPGCVVRLDPLHEDHDAGPRYREASYHLAEDAFVCAISARVLSNVIGWALGDPN